MDKKYTVVLTYPDNLPDSPPTYIATDIVASGVVAAWTAARKQAFRALPSEDRKGRRERDFGVLVVFAGRPKVAYQILNRGGRI